jgi:2-keto-myo-inositol isomerase
MALRFALNHMSAPALRPEALFALARRLGITEVEIRNDLAGNALIDGTPASAVRAAADAAGVTLITINALQRFNQWSPARAAEARELAAYCKASGTRALVLVPVNDTAWTPDTATRLAGLRESLKGLAPILANAGIVGFVEPLGFPECSLRLKREAIDAIDELGLAARFKVVHDTFHHRLSGETEMFPARTGLVHVSGMEDTSFPVELARDAHRVLVGPADLLGNCEQVRALAAGGYAGPLSFEPFAESVHRSRDIEADLRASMDFLAKA